MRDNKKYFVAFGTRPEAIKLSPVITELINNVGRTNVFICNTGQHRDMVEDVLRDFKLTEDCDLNLMKEHQTPTSFVSTAIPSIEEKLMIYKPDVVIVQGDTMSGLSAAFAAKYNKYQVAHIEAGLRTHDWMNPFPEELNRKIIGVLTDFHFAATESGKNNLISEGVSENHIYVSGNTTIDALLTMSKIVGDVSIQEILSEVKVLDGLCNKSYLTSLTPSQIVLVTLHRRESFGKDINEAFLAVKSLLELFPELLFLLPAHPNPNVRHSIKEIFNNGENQITNLVVCEPLRYKTLVSVLNHSALVITDSGGLQEEAPALGVPVVVARNATERMESINLNLAFLTGCDYRRIIEVSSTVLNDLEFRKRLKANKESPYGDGNAAKRIVSLLIDDVLQKSIGEV